MKTYSIDPSKISLGRFQELIRTRRMLPGRVMLQEELNERFEMLSQAGIDTLADLVSRLDSKDNIKRFAGQSGLGVNYLVLLKREAASYLARPFPLSDFPGIPYEYTELLKSKGIRNTRRFFELAQTDEQRKKMAGNTGIPEERLRELYALCDLSRITGVGAAMARMVYESGIRSTREFSGTKERFSAELGEEDIRYCLAYAKVIAEMDRNQEPASC